MRVTSRVCALQVGAATLAGILVMVLFIPVNGMVARLLKRMQSQLMKQKDKRVNMTNEVRVCAQPLWHAHWCDVRGGHRACPASGSSRCRLGRSSLSNVLQTCVRPS